MLSCTVWMRMAAKGSRVAARVADVPGLIRGQMSTFRLTIHGAQSLRMPGSAVFTQERVPRIESPVLSCRITVTLFHAGTRRFLSRTWSSSDVSPVEGGGVNQHSINQNVSLCCLCCLVHSCALDEAGGLTSSCRFLLTKRFSSRLMYTTCK